MGKKIILTAICLLVSMVASDASMAGNFYLNGNAGLVWLQDTDLTENNVSREFTFDSGFGFGGGGGYDFDFMRVEAEIVYRRNDVNKVSTVEYGNVDGSGDMSSLSFMVSGFYDFKNTTFLTPYIGAGLRDFIERTGHDTVKDVGIQFFRRKCHQIKTCHRPAAHGIHVTDRICCGNLTEKIRIVYRRCDNVGRGDDGRFVRESVDTGIVTGIKADQQVWILVFRQSS